ncbi:MAG: hypothetical protein J6B01_05440 [Ruminococcus sp.]|nr:hypothetical protein [Ruminococcus sp.]
MAESAASDFFAFVFITKLSFSASGAVSLHMHRQPVTSERIIPTLFVYDFFQQFNIIDNVSLLLVGAFQQDRYIINNIESTKGQSNKALTLRQLPL